MKHLFNSRNSPSALVKGTLRHRLYKCIKKPVTLNVASRIWTIQPRMRQALLDSDDLEE